MRLFLSPVWGASISIMTRYLHFFAKCWSFHRTPYTNTDILHITKNNCLRNVILYIGHVCCCQNTTLTKMMLFAKPGGLYKWDSWINIACCFCLRMNFTACIALYLNIFVVYIIESIHWSRMWSWTTVENKCLKNW